jgi:hypothetical protein
VRLRSPGCLATIISSEIEVGSIKLGKHGVQVRRKNVDVLQLIKL